MNRLYLGDALDHWKGSLLQRLQEKKLLVRLSIEAMASDAADWKSPDWKLLADLLRVSPAQIVRHPTTLNGDRAGYFEEIPKTGDVFLDPDTGIATGGVKNRSQYLFASEIHALLATPAGRVVAVYQHIRAMTTRTRLTAIMSTLGVAREAFYSCSYESPTVAMLFFSTAAQRIEAIHTYFGTLLKDHAPRRTYLWHFPSSH